MPPRLLLRPATRAVVPPSTINNNSSSFLRRLYSSDAAGPVITVTNVPSPNSGHIRVLELNRPKARNAISKDLLAALRSEVTDIQNQYGPNGEENPNVQKYNPELGPTRALVIASAVDSCFCAGADLKERRTFTQKEYVFQVHNFILFAELD